MISFATSCPNCFELSKLHLEFIPLFHFIKFPVVSFHIALPLILETEISDFIKRNIYLSKL